MKLRTQPVAKQPQQPYTRCLHVRLGHRLSSCFIPTACCIADTAAESLTPLTAPFALPAALPTLTLIDVSAVFGSSSFFLNGLRVLSWTSFGSFLPILTRSCDLRAGQAASSSQLCSAFVHTPVNTSVPSAISLDELRSC
jgi:hypothetical protein